ncbi:MAG TPA: tetratricopeptide repeat protein, partial [Terriglobales bacterium]|nr:tetratricopeptide repeat protein [Terriglobales bacterium]
MFFKAERRTPIAICAVLAASCLILAAPLRATSVHRKKQIALEQYHKALEMREALNGRPDDQRTVDDYERVIEAFRKVYHVAPTSTRADASVLAVGDLLAQQARVQGSEKGFNSAIEQYQFLAREYPGSKYRFEALFTIGQIYKEDLGDDASAKATFEDFLKKYPRHPLAEDARAALKEIDSDQEKAATAERLDVAGASKTAHPKTELASAKHKSAEENVSDESDDNDSPASRRHKLPLVTSIRYWSTPDY